MSLKRKKTFLQISFGVDTNYFAPVYRENYLTRVMKKEKGGKGGKRSGTVWLTVWEQAQRKVGDLRDTWALKVHRYT
jgi:hypothetical protein